MHFNKVLFIGLVWPEPKSSAAGTHLLQLIRLFRTFSTEVHFASAAQPSPYSFDLNTLGVNCHQIALNHSSFNALIAHHQYEVVVFDRFISEEQYGWRVQQECPDAIRILDTEDLHFLRKARQEASKKKEIFTSVLLFSDEAKREIAAILRSDLSLIISEYECDLLKNQFHIHPNLITYLPFLEEKITSEQAQQWLSFDNRKGFAFIGNFLHEPNWQAVKTLKNDIWPLIRKKLPSAKLNIYGAYCSEKVYQLENKSTGFLVHGRAEDARNTLEQHRILLSPILFGAGLKGKLVDAMQSGTPSITTPIGAEGMQNKHLWPGAICEDWNTFSEKAVEIYLDTKQWTASQAIGIELHNSLFDREVWEAKFKNQLATIADKLSLHRQENFIGEILKMQHLQSTKYFSLWIEEKNKKSEP